MADPEKRQDPRFVTSTQVELTIEGGDHLHEVWTDEISKGGLFVRTTTPPSIGTKLEVRLNTPHGTLTLTAEVDHIVGEATFKQIGSLAGVGLKFIDLGPQKKKAFERYIETLAKRSK